ncbi:MAG: hypothetical protein AAGC47_06950 [Bacteroidota bacterium]
MKKITLALLVFFAIGIAAQAQTTEKNEAEAKASSLVAKTDTKELKAEKTAKVTAEKTALSKENAKGCCSSMEEAKAKNCVDSYTKSSCADKSKAKSCCKAKAAKDEKAIKEEKEDS